MIHEATITYIDIDEKGNDRNVKENLVIENEESFAKVEDKLYEMYQDMTDIDVIAIKRSKVKEIANKRESIDDKIWEAIVADYFTDENGVQKELKYKILLYSKTFDGAKAFIGEYLKQGFNMALVGLKCTKFVEVLE
jgi:hypothetical protein